MINAFTTLNVINVNEHTEKKGSLTYLSWVWAWGELKKLYPASYATVYEAANGCIYHTDGKTCWVKTGVTLVDGEHQLEHIEYLPIMDSRNRSIPVGSVTSFDANTAIQRSITKAIARHGLGLYIYAGEDLPEDEQPPLKPSTPPEAPPEAKPANVTREKAFDPNALIEDIKHRYNKDSDGVVQMRKTLIADGVIPNKPGKEMTKEDWMQFVRAVDVKYGA